MTLRLAIIAAFATLVTGCQTGPAAQQALAQPAAPAPSAPAPSAKPPAFVEAACGGCHAVEPPFLSPNPQSPSFAAIANREGLSEATLASWLSDAHNYPEQMDFTLTSAQTQQIADYMITLRRADYRPEQ